MLSNYLMLSNWATIYLLTTKKSRINFPKTFYLQEEKKKTIKILRQGHERHKDISMTDRYSHLTLAHKLHHQKRLADFYANGNCQSGRNGGENGLSGTRKPLFLSA